MWVSEIFSTAGWLAIAFSKVLFLFSLVFLILISAFCTFAGFESLNIINVVIECLVVGSWKTVVGIWNWGSFLCGNYIQ